MTKQCKQCNEVKKLTVLHFRDGYNKGVRYFTNICRRCWNKNEVDKRKSRRNIIRPSKTMHFIRQAVIGHKDEPYYIGENFEYIAPSYNEILKEYENN